MDLRSFVRDVPDFPKKGILFKDITPMLKAPDAFAQVIERLAERYVNHEFDQIVGIESRGFIFGAALALRMNRGFIPMRKPGKLPAETVSQSFNLEYGTDTLEMHKDALNPGDKVLIIDDVLATGGTLEAAAKLVQKVGAEVVEIVTVIELTFLNGQERLAPFQFYSLIQF